MSLNVRHYECDAYNHVNNAHYLNYLEYAREVLLRELDLDYPAWIASGNGIFVSEAHLVYHRPATAGDRLTIASTAVDSGAAWILLQQNLNCGPTPVLEARIKLVWVNVQGRPTRIPADWRARFLENFTAVSSGGPR
jgi:acyl-CoA thioester hydrolase